MLANRKIFCTGARVAARRGQVTCAVLGMTASGGDRTRKCPNSAAIE
jgi:hypothetical protein